jgi:hypothetical protein
MLATGVGLVPIGPAGELLDRALVERIVAYGERLCFEGAPIIEPPLAQDVRKRTPDVFEGEAIDTGLVVPRLTEYERQLVDEAKAASAEALGRTAAEIRVEHDRTLAKRISASRVCHHLGEAPAEARHGVRCRIWSSSLITWALSVPVLADPIDRRRKTLAIH